MFANAKKKTAATTVDTEQHALHRKYRPTKLDRYLGQEAVVTRIRGMLETGKIPSAMAFFGPRAAGKTTLARIIATEVNGKPVEKQGDYKELNAATQKGIDDVRELEKLSKFRAMSKRRFIVIDEAQQWLSNAQAAQAVLKPLEEPSKDTTWIICSMEPERFNATEVGRAILSRCTQYVLDAPTVSDLGKQALRIAKGEGMDYVLDEDRAIIKQVAKNCNGNMRELANLMQSLQQFYDGIQGKKPKLLTPEDVTTAIASTVSADEKLAIQFMVAAYSRNYADAYAALLDVSDQFGFVKKLVWIAQFIMGMDVLNGAKHPKLWWNTANKAVYAEVKKMGLNRGFKAAVLAKLLHVQAQAGQFAIPATDLLAAHSYDLFIELDRHAK
ncbi:DNA polymerase III gamma/tau subunit [Burkholderia phage BcepSauron]|uniref:DNA polymerase III gamma/tau subunit n=1 Tax=Burkholderia phage BcepSauron TaxID=2530033 RepID=A0A482MMC7_9CAUD|nr:clamp loader of DNA polymerase [Burkholderia phage BcepSauron]QBQ74676.1 DNA polymerase III gamma/tau subunit [Burkholderia phage BcepSauron]